MFFVRKTRVQNPFDLHHIILVFWHLEMKKGIHPQYHKDVAVQCICWAEFTVNATTAGPIKVETCYKCHPVFNKDRVVEKVVKGRLEKFMEKQKKIDSLRKSS